MSLKGKKVLLGVTGGIAAYKIPNLVRLLTKDGAEVRVMMTKGATQFVTPLTLETVSQQPVITDMWPVNEFVATRHIDWAEWPDLILIAPATANFLGKVVSGISDDFVTTLVTATAKPIMIAPAMNPQMWLNPVTQRNIKALTEFGHRILEPDDGEMACDSTGIGRMPEPEQLFAEVNFFFARQQNKTLLAGKSFLITAGPCREAIDPVRFISNRSSGKMGFALAEAARDFSAKTTLVTGPTSLSYPSGMQVHQVESTQEMFDSVSQYFSKADCLIMAAAPADFKPAQVRTSKIKKSKETDLLTLFMEPTVDILRALGAKRKKGQLLVGFALETDNGVAEAKRKLEAKKLDMIVLNTLQDSGAGFEQDTNKVTILTKSGKSKKLPLMSKKETAHQILEFIASMM